MATIPPRPSPSALQNLLQQHPIPQDSPHEPHLHHLALQIAHNLRYQHGWTSLRLHYYNIPVAASSQTKQPLPRPLISGLPPQRLYIHPDEQIELLQQQKNAGKTGMPEMRAEREWVLPSHLREKWTLRRFGEVFAGVGAVPRVEDGTEGLFDDGEADDGAEGVIGHGKGEEEDANSPWRTSKPKRLLLATLDDDSTVVYYIVHDGIVKPRQN